MKLGEALRHAYHSERHLVDDVDWSYWVTYVVLACFALIAYFVFIH